jgi:hypothetical protein
MNAAKLGARMVIAYVPAGRLMLKWPAESESASRWSFAFSTWMVALGMIAPLGSETVPLSVIGLAGVCAKSLTKQRSKKVQQVRQGFDMQDHRARSRERRRVWCWTVALRVSHLEIPKEPA